jgi:hypothetical protein
VTDVGDLPREYAQCRAYRHAWRPTTVEVLPRKAGYIQGLACIRCGAQRTYQIDRYGYIVKRNHYVYPEGYALQGHGRLTPDEQATLRLMSIGEAP